MRYRLGSAGGYDDYLAGHLPGAAYVDMVTALAGIAPDGAGGRHPMPDAQVFAAPMRVAGVRTSAPVVAYDDWSSLAASRAWWLLRYFGKPEVYVLDGGLASWRAAGGEIASGATEPERGDVEVAGPARTLLNADGAASLARDGALLAGRPADRFRGENESIDPVAGHIPGAGSMPALANLDADGRFLPTNVLASRFSAAGIEPGRALGTYCGSGIQATHLALALQIAGVADDPGVYVGSWSDWVSDPSRPVELGAERRTG